MGGRAGAIDCFEYKRAWERRWVEYTGKPWLACGNCFHERMSVPVEPLRPAVISDELKESLSEYLRFRHLFRYIYGFKLRWDRCEELLLDMPNVRARLEEELHFLKNSCAL